MQNTLATVVMPMVIESLSQQMDVFNEASGGALVLSAEGVSGDFLQQSFFSNLQAASRDVDRYATNASVPTLDLSQVKTSGVKLAAAMGPIGFEPSQLTWLSQPTSAGLAAATKQFSDIILANYVNKAIGALVAAIANNPDAVHNAAAVNHIEINNAHAKFGDRSSDLIANIMTGATYHALIGTALNNAEHLFTSESVRVVDILGKRTVVTDAPELFKAGKQRVLSLTRGAVTVMDDGDKISNVETSNGKSRIETTVQVDYAFALTMKGYSWDEVAGGKSPLQAKLFTGTNWVKKASDIKQTAGTILIAG
jgi:hypothetical protein